MYEPLTMRLPRVCMPGEERVSVTAEIIIMNSRAIALAADSAATVTTGLGGAKIFSSDDKIFTLTESAPVGIMTFGKADFMGIPFETIITEYRRRQGSETRPHLKDYANRFLAFLKDEIAKHVSEDVQNEFILNLARGLTREIAELIESELSRLRVDLADEDEDTAQARWEFEGSRLISDIIDEYRSKLDEAEHVDGMGGEVLRQAEQLLESQTDEILAILNRLDLTVEEMERLLQVVNDALPVMTEDVSLRRGGDYSGIVVAGFGEEDLLPAYYEYHIEGLFQSTLKSREVEYYEIEDSDDSEITPFAQGDVIYTFLFGIYPSLLRQSQELFGEMLRDFVEELMANLDRYSNEERESILSGLEQSIELTADSFRRDVFGRAFDQHYGEIASVASFMPKEQLAEMAEALINLTSLRRRVSFDEETVGGPTDVAVITKSDGLVWVKRKQ